MTIRWLIPLLLLLGFTAPARADDISASARGVVRVVTIAVVDDEVVGFGHGSGFAVAPNRIVTNAHVVELAARYPDNVVIGVVPSEGAKSYQGKVIAIDTARDLALIEFSGVRLPTLALYTGPVEEGGSVTALGYPGNVDLATARSAADYIRPLSPIRSEGVFSGRRMMSDVQVLLHTAGIARGNSGGPLLDPCGRVIGVNSALTRGEDGDTSFGFAIADVELTTFLNAADQRFTAVGTPCTSLSEQLRQDTDADAATAAEAARLKADAASKAAEARAAAMVKARDDAQRNRENIIAIAALLLALGVVAFGTAGFLELRGQRSAALWVAGGAALAFVAALAVFLARPSGEPILPPAPPPLAPTVNSDAALGKLICTVVPARSRVTVSSLADVALDWREGGCMNGRTQYAENGSKWDRILVPSEDQTVSVLQFDPATKLYTNTRYLLTAAQMDAARKIRSQVSVKACSPDIAARANLSTQQAAIRAALPPLPNERIVYSCKSAP
ncbi:S1C family serine protease [Sphingomonas sp. PB4P5]|uniref:S1C family serine protease n=1 Tax=Parasphingomonas puruogangriensis TaxID=3096155 RepID=UPI002FCAF2C1